MQDRPTVRSGNEKRETGHVTQSVTHVSRVPFPVSRSLAPQFLQSYDWPMLDLRDRLQSALGPAYRLDNELGGGGMSRVCLAEEVRLGRQGVVKVLPPEMAAGVNAERCEGEWRLAAKRQRPNS